VWKESFPFLIKHYSAELKPFTQVEQPALLKKIVGAFKFKKYKPDQIIDFSKGGIFLKGKAEDLSEKKLEESPSSNVDKHSETPKIFTGNRVYRALTMVPTAQPGAPPVRIKCSKVCSVFHFDNMEELKESLMNWENERGEKDRSSFRSFSMAKPVAYKRQTSNLLTEEIKEVPHD